MRLILIVSVTKNDHIFPMKPYNKNEIDSCGKFVIWFLNWKVVRWIKDRADEFVLSDASTEDRIFFFFFAFQMKLHFFVKDGKGELEIFALIR